MPLHCHKLVFETAKSMAHELYDALMQKNDWYALWKTQNPGLGAKALEDRFVRKNHAKMVPAARAALAGMLSGPYPDEVKDQIFEALLLDNSLTHGRPRMVPAARVMH